MNFFNEKEDGYRSFLLMSDSFVDYSFLVFLFRDLRGEELFEGIRLAKFGNFRDFSQVESYII